MAYRAIVLSSEPAADGSVHLLVQVENNHDGEWKQTSIGRRTLILDSDAILAITTSKRSLANRRAAIKALMVKQISAWGIDKSDDANEQLTALVYQGFPQTIDLPS